MTRVSFVLGLAFIAVSHSARAADSKPNVLFIAVDDLNDWVGFMGGHPNAKTPHIDRLAKRGSVFLNAHCQAPICGPSRASLMLGLHPHTTGIYGHIRDADIRRVNETAARSLYLPEYFRKYGYKTMGVGKLFHGHAPKGVFDVSGGREKGFGPKPKQRLNWDARYTSTDWGAFPESDEQMPDSRSTDWAIDQLEQEHDKPFFLAVGFLRPHVPWHVPQKWFDQHSLRSLQNPPYLPGDYSDIPSMAETVARVSMMPTTRWAIENDKWTEITQAYLACTTFVDRCVGRVLDALQQSPYADNTVVVLWSDHGYHLGEKNRFAKHALWKEATHVPLIIVGPNVKSGQRISGPVGLIDLYPTLIDLCGLERNPRLEGRSLKPLLEDPFDEWPHHVLTAYGRDNYAVTAERYRYIRYEDGSEELYDHLTDPHEWTNLASNRQFDEVKRKLAGSIPEDQAPWAEKSFNGIDPYFAQQKERMGTQPPVKQMKGR